MESMIFPFMVESLPKEVWRIFQRLMLQLQRESKHYPVEMQVPERWSLCPFQLEEQLTLFWLLYGTQTQLANPYGRAIFLTQPVPHLFICASSRRLYSEGPCKLVNTEIMVSAQRCDTHTSERPEPQPARSLTIFRQQLHPSHAQYCSSPFNIAGVLPQFCIVDLPLWTSLVLSVFSRGKIPNSMLGPGISAFAWVTLQSLEHGSCQTEPTRI